MSNHRFVSSFGDPYLAFVAERIGTIATLPVGGLAAVLAEFRVDRLPVQSAAPDEMHPFFSFGHDLLTRGPIFEVGITPEGGLKATTNSGVQPSGSTYKSRGGLFFDASAWNRLQITYGVQADGNWDVTINDVEDTSQTDVTPQNPLLPLAGYDTRIILFNGRDGLARTGISIRSLTATFVGASGDNYVWDFGEREGNTLTAKRTVVAPDNLLPAVCVAQFRDPLLVHAWGSVPAGEPGGTYAWGLETDYARQPQKVTRYTRVAA